MLDKIEILLLSIKYYIQQNFTDWEAAKKMATYIVKDTWQ
jgi:hypothetical protein